MGTRDCHELHLFKKEKDSGGNSVVVQRLVLCTFTAKNMGSVPGWGAKIPQATLRGQKKKDSGDLKKNSISPAKRPKMNWARNYSPPPPKAIQAETAWI